MEKFKTWGAAMKSLDGALHEAIRIAWYDLGGNHDRPGYFKRELYVIHHAFQKWCERYGFDPTAIRQEIITRCDLRQMDGLLHWGVLDKLVNWIPREFGVRGVWTPLESTD